MNEEKTLEQVDGVKLIEDGRDPIAVLLMMARADASFDDFSRYVNACCPNDPEGFGKALARIASPDFKKALANVGPSLKSS